MADALDLFTKIITLLTALAVLARAILAYRGRK